MTTNATKVLEHPVTNTQTAADYFRAKLEFGADSADVYHDLVHQLGGFVVVDSRSLENYTKRHIPTAIRFPDEPAMARLDRSKTYVVFIATGLVAMAQPRELCYLHQWDSKRRN